MQAQIEYVDESGEITRGQHLELFPYMGLGYERGQSECETEHDQNKQGYSVKQATHFEYR